MSEEREQRGKTKGGKGLATMGSGVVRKERWEEKETWRFREERRERKKEMKWERKQREGKD